MHIFNLYVVSPSSDEDWQTAKIKELEEEISHLRKINSIRAAKEIDQIDNFNG